MMIASGRLVLMRPLYLELSIESGGFIGRFAEPV